MGALPPCSSPSAQARRGDGGCECGQCRASLGRYRARGYTDRSSSVYPRRGSTSYPAHAPRTYPYATPQPSRTSSQPLQTQSIEQSRRLEETRRAEAEAKARAEAERRAREEAARRETQRQEIGHSVAGAFGRQSGAAGSQGTASSGTGNQGNPNGSAGSYALTGRTIVSNGGILARPSTSRAIDGVVRVRIVVDGSGRVIQATVAQGTNIADTSIRNAALAAARATRFNSVAGADDQEGLITYRFKIQS